MAEDPHDDLHAAQARRVEVTRRAQDALTRLLREGYRDGSPEGGNLKAEPSAAYLERWVISVTHCAELMESSARHYAQRDGR